MKQFKNNKGFLILELSSKEAKSIEFGIPEGCICMHCNNIIEDPIYYIAVLNDCMCKECFNEWILTAKYYKEDKDFEEYNYQRVVELLENGVTMKSKTSSLVEILRFMFI